MSPNNIIRFVLFLLFLFIMGCGGEKPLTVSQVIENAESLNGQTIRVRGRAKLLTDPSESEMWAAGGCVPNTDPSAGQGKAKGWLTLYDPLTQDQETVIRIAESNFHCEGDYCKLTCTPFKVTSYEMYEFVGTLRVNGTELILENLNLEQSRQLIDAEWTALPLGSSDVVFP
jgi:hypothetical protein